MNKCMTMNKVLKSATGSLEKPKAMHGIEMPSPGRRATENIPTFAFFI